jgi:AAA+ ATPase superfamily predicted ATPase
VAPASLQLKEFLEEAARVLSEPLLAQLPPESWQTALEQVVERWGSRKGKLVLVFDEFQWTAGASPELPSVLQALWDRSWRKSGRVMVLLCGSFVGFMEREVLGKKSPLYGRRTGQIHLKPFRFPEARRFHSRLSTDEQALVYFLCGGVAQYLKAFDARRSFRQNVEAELLDEFAPLFREPEFLLREELRDVESYHAVLMAIAAGATSQREIAKRSAVRERSLHYNLEQLIQLGYVARRYPLTGTRPPRTHVRYVLDDALLRFYFRFVFPHRSFLTQHGPSRFWDTLIAPQLDAWAGGCFERLCREALPGLLAAEGVSAQVDVGEYWDREVQIDVVGVRSDARTELGECKWGPVGAAQLARELEAKVQAFPNPLNHTLTPRAFVRSWKGRAPDGVVVHTLKELG